MSFLFNSSKDIPLNVVVNTVGKSISAYGKPDKYPEYIVTPRTITLRKQDISKDGMVGIYNKYTYDKYYYKGLDIIDKDGAILYNYNPDTMTARFGNRAGGSMSANEVYKRADKLSITIDGNM